MLPLKPDPKEIISIPELIANRMNHLFQFTECASFQNVTYPYDVAPHFLHVLPLF